MALNKVMIQGNICKDVELLNTNNGGTYLRNTVAVSRNYVKENEERQSDFISIIAYGKQAEFISKFFQKGSPILIEGEIRTGNYEKDDGTKVYTTDVIVNKTYFVGNKRDNNSDAKQEETKSDMSAELEVKNPSDFTLPF